MTDAYRSADERHWFIPLARALPAGAANAARKPCSYRAARYWQLATDDPWLTYSAQRDTLSFIDPDSLSQNFGGQRRPTVATDTVVTSTGVNYQVAGQYDGQRVLPTGLAEFYGYHSGWYMSSSFGLAPGRSRRFDSYAVKEDLNSGVFLRLGDAITVPSPLGESLRFGGLAWGTDRSLQPADFAPVLPDLRGNGVVAGPLEVFINDTLQVQQQLNSGNFDLRNLPAQQGFNSYSIRTRDVQGNPVTVTRDIYLPPALLPAGATSWRLDAGFRRRDFTTAESGYGRPLAVASYAHGIDRDTSAGGYLLHSRDASLASLEFDQRLSALWAARVAGHTSRNRDHHGYAVQARLEGGGRLWRVFGDWLNAPHGLAGLSSARSPLRAQRLLRAQWTGIPRVSMSFTHAQTVRTGEPSEQVSTLFASAHPFDSSSASLLFSFSRLRSGGIVQRSATVSLYLPLEPSPGHDARSLVGSTTSTSYSRISRVQYSDSATQSGQSSLSAGYDHVSATGQPSIDAVWSAQTPLVDMAASGRVSTDQTDISVSLRSGVVWAQNSTFFTRPVTGSFALVSTGQEGTAVLHDNRFAATTNSNGVALVPSLRALEVNRLSVDPSTWPLHWNAASVERTTVPPRGGGVLVSFRISAESWPKETLVFVPALDGNPYPPGTVVSARVDREERSTVINRKGQVWVGELLPATTFSVRYAGRQCVYKVPPVDGATELPVADLVSCRDAP